MVHVVLPSRLAHLSDREQRLRRGLTPLLREHAESLRVELGAPFEFANEPPPSGPCWLVGPVSCNPALAATHRPSAAPPGALAAPIAPVVPIAHAAPAPPHPILHVDRAAGILISDAPTVDGIFESFSLLKTMHWDGSRTLTSQDCTNVDEAVQRIAHEVATTWPSFERTGIDWHTLVPVRQRASWSCGRDPWLTRARGGVCASGGASVLSSPARC